MGVWERVPARSSTLWWASSFCQEVTVTGCSCWLCYAPCAWHCLAVRVSWNYVLFALSLSFFLSFLGYFLCCCCCCGLWTRRTANLDAYAPRTQSIVWPQVPEETARVVELTFLHEPGSVDCLCRNCELARDQRCIPHCSASAECWWELVNPY